MSMAASSMAVSTNGKVSFSKRAWSPPSAIAGVSWCCDSENGCSKGVMYKGSVNTPVGSGAASSGAGVGDKSSRSCLGLPGVGDDESRFPA